MNNNLLEKREKTKRIFKIVLGTVCIIIPLMCAFFLCKYTFNRHKDSYINKYIYDYCTDDDGKDIEDSLLHVEAFLKYTKRYYKKVSDKEVKLEDTHLCNLAVYEVLEDVYVNDVPEEDIIYYFFAYNVDYKEIRKWAYTGEEDEFFFEYNDTPGLYVHLTSPDKEKYRFISLSEFEDSVVYDYGKSPDYDDSNVNLDNLLVQYATYTAINLPEENVCLSLLIYDDKGEEKSVVLYDEENLLELNQTVITVQDTGYEGYEICFNGNYNDAGYKGYLLKHYWWWEVLVSIAAIGLLTGSFYLVITYEKE